MELPNYNRHSKKGENGLTILKKIVENDLDWIFRKNHQEDDFGIDAYFDIIAEFGQVTGKSIAVQVKTGKSYFNEKNDLGWVFRGEMKHLNYYLNHDIPVIIILVNDDANNAFWCLCDPQKTIRAGENWKITIPFNQKLNSSAKKELLKYISPVKDYVSQLEHFWEVNKSLLGYDRLLFMIDREDIESLNFDNLTTVFERFEVNPELVKHLRSKVEVSISGYDNDSRELFDIPEVVKWVKGAFPKVDGWFYFLTNDRISAFLKVLFICHTKFKKEKNGKLSYQKSDSKEFIISSFNGLNKFCDKHGISDEINIEQINKAMDYLTEGEWEKI